MSIADKITRLTTARNNIRTALANKGVSAASHGFESFASDIGSIQTGAANCKRWTVEFISDVTTGTNIIEGDADISAHFRDSTFGVMFKLRGDNPTPISGKDYYSSGYILNAQLYSEIYGISMGRSSSGLLRFSIGGNVNSLYAAGAFYIRSGGIVYALASANRNFPAGTYDIFVFW